MGGHHVPSFRPSSSVVDTATKLVQEFGRPLVCANWRTESAPAAARDAKNPTLMECATAFSGSVVKHTAAAAATAAATTTTTKTMTTTTTTNRSVMLSTDLYAGNSGTYHTSERARAALEQVERTLGGSLNGELMHRLANISDSGLRAFVEVRLCSRASIMVRCAGRSHDFCTKCTKLNSGFVHSIEHERRQLGRPVESWDKTGVAWAAARPPAKKGGGGGGGSTITKAG